MSDHAPATSDAAEERRLDEARRTLAALQAQADAVRAELARLRRDLTQAQEEFSEMRGVQLLEANEQLLLAALQADAVARTAVGNLDELTRSAQRDALTDTPNRISMGERLDSAIAMARRHEKHVGVLFVDLDGFKEINDTLGHAAGDEVLRAASRRLASAVRESDTVSRHGGDEFVVLLPDVAKASDVAPIAEKMLHALAAPAHVGDQELPLSASIGVAVYPEDGEDAQTLVSRADAAMYRAKRQGGHAYAFHADSVVGELEPAAARPAPEAASARDRSAWPAQRHLDLREANEQLVIAAMTAQELEHQVEEMHARQIKFLAMVAHELRNPLAPIRTAAELLKRARTDEALVAKVQGVIERQIGHMTRLVEDLLDGARVSTGKFRLETEQVNMADTLWTAADACRAAMDTKQQQLTVALPEGPLRVRGDPVRLAQVFGNLLENASKYTPEDGHIALSAAVEGGSIVVTVSDDGMGITREALGHVFDLFVQGTRAMTAQNRGLGIGLAVVRELVEAHGGTVEARSAGKDLGSAFIVTLPADGDAVTPPGATTTSG
ncbi:two-component system, OmpR family, sensor histidine kinase VicK [Burkholderiaceae bacterium]|nr:two-component system, OmpR family, sensor histidine kinase VicK [Burkholderiaceae bacterium]